MIDSYHTIIFIYFIIYYQERWEFDWREIINDKDIRVIRDPAVPEDMPIGEAAALVGVEIKKVSAEVGEGVFALKEFKKGDVICGVQGQFVRPTSVPKDGAPGHEYIRPSGHDRKDWLIKMSRNG
jgi:hypothetical protein